MSSELPAATTFWKTVRLLLAAARTRAAGRRKRQQELMRRRSGRNSTDWSGLGFAMAILFMAILNVLGAFLVKSAVTTG